MTENHDPLLEAIARLRTIAPDANWEKRVRARCHSQIALRATGPILPVKHTIRKLTLLDLAALAFLCVYFCVFLRQTAQLLGLP
jgi:hypothetical protein